MAFRKLFANFADTKLNVYLFELNRRIKAGFDSIGPVGDELVKVSAADTVASYLANKLQAGANIVLTVVPGPDEKLQIDATAASPAATTDSAVATAPVLPGQPVGMLPAGTVALCDAAGTLGPKEVYGLAAAAGGPGPITIITEGVCPWAGAALTPGDVLYLAPNVAGGVTNVAPPLNVPNVRIVRVGKARTAASILVRVQVIAET